MSVYEVFMASRGMPVGVIGIGGGSIMDIAKAVSYFLTIKTLDFYRTVLTQVKPANVVVLLS